MEKTLLPLIIMHWNSIWVIKYMLIKVACHFPMHLFHMHLNTWLNARLSVEKDLKMMHN